MLQKFFEYLDYEMPEAHIFDMEYLASFEGQNGGEVWNELAAKYKDLNVVRVPADTITDLQFDPYRIRIWLYADETVYSVTHG